MLRALVVSLVFFTAMSHAAPVLLNKVVAVVDDDVIMASELDQRVSLVKKQNIGGVLPDDNTLRSQVLEQMVMESIQLQMADRGNIVINDAELNHAMTNIAAQNGLSLAEFRQTMESDGIAFSTAREQIKNEMRISRVQRYQVGERIQISDQDVDNFLASEIGKMASSGEYRIGHILIATPANASSKDVIEADKKAVDIVKKLRNGANFQQLAMAESSSRTALEGGDLGWRKEAQLPSLFAAAVPSLNIGEIAGPISSSSGFHIIKLLDKRGGNTKLVTQYKTRHILISPNEIRDDTAAGQQAQDLYKRLTNGDDFALLAREYSDDPGSGAQGGDLGWVNEGDMVPSFNDTMLNIPTGQISTPFKSQFGWHILQVEEKRETDVGVENQRNQVRNLLYGRRFEDELPIWLRKMRSEAYVEIK